MTIKPEHSCPVCPECMIKMAKLLDNQKDEGRREALKEVLNKFVSGINSNEFHKWLIKRLEELSE